MKKIHTLLTPMIVVSFNVYVTVVRNLFIFDKKCICILSIRYILFTIVKYSVVPLLHCTPLLRSCLRSNFVQNITVIHN